MLLFLMTQMHLNDDNLYFIFTDVTELFTLYFRLLFFILVQLTTWYFFYQVFSFVRPALYTKEFKLFNFIFTSSTFFWFFTVLFSSYVLIPFGWKFFLSFQVSKSFYFEAQISKYFDFYFNAYYFCLTYFQFFSLLFLILADIKKNYIYIKRYRKFYYYIFLLFSTCVTPPDIVSQLVTTFFFIISYEFLILLLTFYCFK